MTADPAAGAAPLPLTESLDILLVEDDPFDVELALRSLRRSAPHRRIGVARDGEEALDYLLGRGRYRPRFGAPTPRLILLDLKLPKIDGLDVLRALRNSPRTGTAPVVVLTPAVDGREVLQCYQLGANSCVRKSADFQALDRALRAVAEYWLELNEPPTPARAAG